MNAVPFMGSAVRRRAAGAEDRPIRLLVVDDSLVVRTILGRMIAQHRDLELVGLAGNVEQALTLLSVHRVDIILLDLEMPGRDGLSALPALIERGCGARILIVSSFCDSGASATVRALTLGAADTLHKPSTASIGGSFAEALLSRLRRIGHAPAQERDRSVRSAAVQESLTIPTLPARSGAIRCLAIGASTGGPHALTSFLSALPPAVDAPILITQHLPAMFMSYFAGQLQEIAGRKTHVARDGDFPLRGEIIVAPGDAHLTVRMTPAGPRVVIDQGPAPSGCAPSVDPMFSSVAEAYGSGALGVMLSGMGRDGAIGARELVAAGGELLVQDASSSVIWGMPGTVARAGIASLIGPPAALAERAAQRAGASAWN
jgi:two-component system chemotaxis response regulator CheB